MSLDYQRTVYRQHRPSVGQSARDTRTTYANMSQWQSHLPQHKRTKSALDYLEEKRWPVHLQYSQSGGYDDFHKSFLKHQRDQGPTTGFPALGPPRLRNGKNGGSWRHVKDVLQAAGSRRVFVDGVPGADDIVALQSKTVPAGSRVHPVALFPSSLYGPRVAKPRRTPSYDLRAFKGTESANWMIMR